ncbi:hypothetical protein EVAR_67299_1 [Eumeta japonica]|uniref:Uncharacterized protein n=1 Tax=Eumeta variegata TaxID=151549 RepID=A0A4C2ADD1_EUMVA|nr:hypothetical protein EVAR_67299_1 [Eumeta japonica]
MRAIRARRSNYKKECCQLSPLSDSSFQFFPPSLPRSRIPRRPRRRRGGIVSAGRSAPPPRSITEQFIVAEGKASSISMNLYAATDRARPTCPADKCDRSVKWTPRGRARRRPP